jgi:hypothetical protein
MCVNLLLSVIALGVLLRRPRRALDPLAECTQPRLIDEHHAAAPEVDHLLRGGYGW